MSAPTAREVIDDMDQYPERQARAALTLADRVEAVLEECERVNSGAMFPGTAAKILRLLNGEKS